MLRGDSMPNLNEASLPHSLSLSLFSLLPILSYQDTRDIAGILPPPTSPPQDRESIASAVLMNRRRGLSRGGIGVLVALPARDRSNAPALVRESRYVAASMVSGIIPGHFSTEPASRRAHLGAVGGSAGAPPMAAIGGAYRYVSFLIVRSACAPCGGGWGGGGQAVNT